MQPVLQYYSVHHTLAPYSQVACSVWPTDLQPLLVGGGGGEELVQEGLQVLTNAVLSLRTRVKEGRRGESARERGKEDMKT